MPYLKRINSLPLINHISYKYAQVSDIGPSWSSCWSLRSDKQMDIKLFTEFLKKKKDPSKNMASMEDSFSCYGAK